MKNQINLTGKTIFITGAAGFKGVPQGRQSRQHLLKGQRTQTMELKEWMEAKRDDFRNGRHA